MTRAAATVCGIGGLKYGRMDSRCCRGGSAAWSVEQADAAALVRRAKDAAVIMIRGRTDATGDSMQETALARVHERFLSRREARA